MQKLASNEVWVVDASPVIALANVGHLALLDRLADIWIPPAVASEILAGPPADPARRALETGWGHPAKPRRLSESILEWGLGAGETAVLSLCLETGRTAILDDAAARSCARAFDVPVLGTLGIVLRAKRTGLIPSAAQVLEALLGIGFRLDHKTVRLALDRATGEHWPYGG